MDDLTAFDRQIAAEFLRDAGPSEPVDDAAILTAITAARSTTRRFESMFSAAKFAAAGAVVALVGGFLVAGVLTRPIERALPGLGASASAPAAATAAIATSLEPSPQGDVNDAAMLDLLPGVALTVEMVEPGVLRVLSDGWRPLSYAGSRRAAIVVGRDGSVWQAREDARGSNPLVFVEVGVADDRVVSAADDVWPEQLPLDFGGVGPDGSLWAIDVLAGGKWTWGIYGQGIGVFDGDGWTIHEPNEPIRAFAMAPDGAAWAVWGTGLYRFDGGRPSFVTELPDATGRRRGLGGLAVSDDGDVWWSPGGEAVFRYDGRTWLTVKTPTSNGPVAVGHDGTLWRAGSDALYRFDGRAWRTWQADERWPELRASRLELLPDGRLWMLGSDVDAACGQVALFDGGAWTRYLPDHCVLSADASPDGVAWVQAIDQAIDGSGNDVRSGAGTYPPEIHTYVIIPDAVPPIE